MLLTESLVAAIINAEDEYELIAICYNTLMEHIKDNDLGFITSFTREMDRAPQFAKLRENFLGKAEAVNARIDCDGTGFDAFKTSLIDELHRFSPPDSVEESECLSICMFSILEALDIYVEKKFVLCLFILQNRWAAQ